MIYWIFSIFSMLFCYILNNVNVDKIIVSVCFITLFSIILTIKIFRLKADNYFRIILIIALILRIILVFTDVYIHRLPDAGKDDDGFYNVATYYYKSDENFNINSYGSYFTLIIYILFHFIGTARIGVQCFNVFISIIGLIIMYKTLSLTNLNVKSKKILMTILCFMPYIMFSNSILRRDSLITFFMILAIYNLIKWTIEKKFMCCVKACLFIVCGALFHTAVIFSLAIFIAFFMLYNHKLKRVKIKGTGYVKSIVMLLLILIFGIYFLANFNSKFSSVDSIDDIYKSVNRFRGGSVYLTNVKINTISQLIIWSPVKLVYFLFSPMPWNFRNIMDIASFFMDSCIYLFYTIKIMKIKKMDSSGKCLLLCYIIVGLVFALGTFNSGTAIRHRYNILPFLIIAYATKNELKDNIKLMEENNK